MCCLIHPAKLVPYISNCFDIQQRWPLIKEQMRINLQLIDNYKQTLPSLVMTVNNQKYIFNVPETFQRFTKEHRFKYSTGTAIFFTKTCSASVAGLLGLMLTLVDQGQCFGSKIFVPPRLFDYFNEVRYQKGSKILPYAFVDWTGRIQRGMDKSAIDYILSRSNYPALFHNINQYIDKLSKQQINDPAPFIKNSFFEDENLRVLPVHLKTPTDITHFICISNNVPGKVNNQKLKEFKITGKNISRLLTEGQLVLDTGVKVFSKDFRDQQQPGSVWMIAHFDCVDNIEKTLGEKVFQENLQKIENVVYIVQSRQIIKSESFKKFLSLFGQKCHHLVYCEGLKDVQDYIPETTKHYKLTNQLANYFPQHVAPIDDFANKQLLDSLKTSLVIQQLFPGVNIEMYKRYYELVISPLKLKGYTIEKKVPMNEQISKPQPFSKSVSEQKLWDFSQVDPLVIFLGTGSMKPSTYRNVTGIFVGLNKSSIILDCGEGTYQQLLNQFGPRIGEVMLSIRVIFITHVHSDHHLGVLNLISQRMKLRQKIGLCNKDMFLIIPYNLGPAVWAYNQHVEQLGCNILFIQTILGESYEIAGNQSKDQAKCYKMDPNDISDQFYSTPKQQFILQNYYKDQKQVKVNFEKYMEQDGISKFQPVHVLHCPQSYGIVITLHSGAKISYSGDTRPVNTFINASANSTLMIHEATFGDDLADNAKQNMHSTVGEAIHSALKSNSWRLALTHFSQRYKNSASILDLNFYKDNGPMLKYAKENTIVCFDHLQMRLSETEYMPQVSRIMADVMPAQENPVSN